MAGDKIKIAIEQSNTFDIFSNALLTVEKKNMPNSIVTVDLDDEEIFVEVKLNKSTMKDSVTSTEILDSAIRVLKNVCEDTVDIDNLRIYLNNVNRRANTVRLRIVKPLAKQ